MNDDTCVEHYECIVNTPRESVFEPIFVPFGFCRASVFAFALFDSIRDRRVETSENHQDDVQNRQAINIDETTYDAIRVSPEDARSRDERRIRRYW